MFFSRAWPVRFALVMKARAPSTTATFAWTLPSTKGSGFSFQVKISAVGTRERIDGCGVVVQGAAVTRRRLEQNANTNAAARCLVQRRDDAGDVVGDEAHEERSLVWRACDEVEKDLLCPSRRNEARRRTCPDQLDVQLTIDAQARLRRAEEHARNLISARLHLLPCGNHALNGSACRGRVGERVRRRSRRWVSRAREMPNATVRTFAGETRATKVHDRIEERLHQIPAKNAASVDLERRDDEGSIEIAVAALA